MPATTIDRLLFDLEHGHRYTPELVERLSANDAFLRACVAAAVSGDWGAARLLVDGEIAALAIEREAELARDIEESAADAAADASAQRRAIYLETALRE